MQPNDRKHSQTLATSLETDPLVDGIVVRRLIGNVSEPTLFRMVRTGVLPKPIKIGKLSRWRLSTIESYVAAREAAARAAA